MTERIDVEQIPILYGMTESERDIMKLLCEALGKFCKLSSVTQDQIEDFNCGIHRCQDQIAVQVARRVEPGEWA